jgi:hypothetical protein
LIITQNHVSQQWGKLPARALRCTEPWHRTGRIVILDASFAYVLAARGFAEQGLFMIGNMKGGHKEFPKKWLLDKVHVLWDHSPSTSGILGPFFYIFS